MDRIGLKKASSLAAGAALEDLKITSTKGIRVNLCGAEITRMEDSIIYRVKIDVLSGKVLFSKRYKEKHSYEVDVDAASGEILNICDIAKE